MVWLAAPAMWWLVAWIQPITRKTTDNRNVDLNQQSSTIVPKTVVPEKNPQMMSTLDEPITREYKKSTIDNSLQDIDWKINQLKGSMFTTKNIWGLNQSTVGSQFAQPKLAEQTAFVNMPKDIQQNIGKEIINKQTQQPIQEQQKEETNLPQLTINSNPDEFNDKEINFMKQAKEQWYSLDETIQFINDKRKEWWVSDFKDMSLYWKLMYTPKDDAEKKSMPWWWKVVNLWWKTQEDVEKMWITKEDQAANAAFIAEFPRMLSNIDAFVRWDPKLKERWEKAAQEVYKWLWAKEWEGGFNEQAAKFTAQLLPTLLVPEWKIAGIWTKIMSKVPYLSKLLSNPLASKVIKNSLSWLLWMETFTVASEGRNINPLEAWLALIPWATTLMKPMISKWLLKVAQWLETSGIINPAKFAQIQEKLLVMWEKWFEKASTRDVSQWMLDRNIKWSKEQIVQQLTERWTKAEEALSKTLETSQKTYNKTTAQSVEPILDKLEQEYSDSISTAYRDKLKKIQEYKQKLNNWTLTLKEINEIKQSVWKDLNPYTSSWKVKAASEDLSKATSELRSFIEKEAENTINGVKASDISLLNNEISTSYGLAEWIARKEATDFRQELINFWSARWGGMIAWWLAGSQVWPFDKNTIMWKVWNILVWAFLWKMTSSTNIKTWLANKIANTFTTKEMPILEKYLEWFSKWWITPKIDKNIENKLIQVSEDIQKQNK